MTAAFLAKQPKHQNGIQPVDLSRHLGGIAELIELCFSQELDGHGRNLLRELRWLSKTGPALRLLNALLMGRQPWDMGYVWVEGGRVIGTVSTQRSSTRSLVWLIANVAVHPEYRRRGVALALMQATLHLIESHQGTAAVLQVDDDNQAAIKLYQQLGFRGVATKITWTRAGRVGAPPFQPSAFDIRLRGAGDWSGQFALAQLVRPEGLAWNQPLQPGDFRPNLWRQADLFVSGRGEEHWVAEAPGEGHLAGSLIVRTGDVDGDSLTVLVHPEYRGQLERPLLTRGLRRLGTRFSPVRVEHEVEDARMSGVLQELGFSPRRVLRWMQRDMRRPARSS